MPSEFRAALAAAPSPRGGRASHRPRRWRFVPRGLSGRSFSAQLVFIRFVGTHEEYDDVDAEEVQVMDIRPIHKEKQHKAALKEIERLTLDMIRRLHRLLGIPAEVLLAS
jgi:hypothetical protein